MLPYIIHFELIYQLKHKYGVSIIYAFQFHSKYLITHDNFELHIKENSEALA